MAAEDPLALPVRYRGVDLNTVNLAVGGRKVGCLLEEFDWGNVPGLGYVEKRAQDDGYDASDVFLGMRVIRLQGTVYGADPADVQDRLQVIRTIMTPTVAYAADAPRYGYLPLEFSIPTNLTADFPLGYRDVELRARPRGQPTFVWRRDAGMGRGEEPNRGGAIMWQALLDCRDPRLYVRPDIWHYFSGASGPTLKNRGDYPAPLDILLNIPANAATSASARVDITDGDGNTLRLKVPQSASAQVLRWSGTLKVATLEVGSVESLRQDLRQFLTNSDRLVVPPGSHPVTIAPSALSSLGAANTTRLMYSESFA